MGERIGGAVLFAFGEIPPMVKFLRFAGGVGANFSPRVTLWQ